MKKLLFALLLTLVPVGVSAQTAQTYYTFPTVASIKALTTRPAVVQVVDANPGIFNWGTTACSAADDIFQITPTSGPTGCYTRAATPYSAGKGSATSVLTSNGSVPSWSSTLPAVTAGAATVTATGTTVARSLTDRFAQTFSPQDFTGATDDVKIQSCLTAAAAAQGVCVVPQKGSNYTLSAGITIPQNASLQCEGNGVILATGANGIVDFVKFRSNSGSFIQNCVLANLHNATNGLVFDPVTFGGNNLKAFNVSSSTFVNNFYNRNADYFTLSDSFSQNATGNSLRSVQSGTGSQIFNFKTLGDANGLYFTTATGTIEGVVISNGQFLQVAAGSYSIKFEQSLAVRITDTIVQGSIIFDGTTNAHADIGIKGVFVTGITNTVGVDFIGNIADVNIDGLTSSTTDGCALRFKSTATHAVQRGKVSGYLGLANGTSAGSADLCIDSSLGQGIGQFTVGNSWFTSSGGSVKSVIETLGAGTIQVTYEPSNTYASTNTLVQTNAMPVSGTVPYVNSSLFTSYSTTLPASLTIPTPTISSPTFSGANITVPAATFLGWTGSTVMRPSANGYLVLSNNAVTDFSAIQLGGTTSSFPAIRRNGAGIDFLVANLSAYAAITSSTITTNGAINSTYGGQVLGGTGATTGSLYTRFTNTTGDIVTGLETSAGGTLFVGTSAYASVIGSKTATALQLASNNNVRMTIASGGDVSVLSTTDSSSSTTGSLITAGGLGVAKTVYIGTSFRMTESGGSYYIGPTGAQTTYLQSNNLQSVVLNTDGSVGIGVVSGSYGVNNLKVGGTITAPSITFGSGTALDAYVATTWTPTIATSGTGGTPAYTTQIGSYEKVGRQITARFNITLSGWTGSPTGNVYIGGLPAAAATDVGHCYISYYNVTGLSANYSGLTGYIVVGQTTPQLFTQGNINAAAVSAAEFGTTGTVAGTCIYRI